jgi:hypothetical protein
VSVSASQYQGRQTEAEFMAAVKQFAELHGWLCWHFPNAIINPCVPDLFLFREGELLLAELKTERGKISFRQEQMLIELGIHGIYVHVWRPSMWDAIGEVLR